MILTRAITFAFAATVVTASTITPAHATAAPPPRANATTTTQALLNQLTVTPETNRGYKRTYFKHWITTNKCTTRNQVLKDESLVPATANSRCTVTAGKWVSRYDNVTITNPRQLDIDHMVPLAEAWGSGANKWSAERRKQYANDLGYAGSLIAVTAHTNREKSDDDVAEWVPPNAAYKCTYLQTWIAVKYRWNLNVDRTERDVAQKLVVSCKNPRIVIPPKA